MSKERNRKSMLKRIENIGKKEYNRYHNHNYAVKKRILKNRTHGYCMICRKLFPRALLHIDHIVPVMLGGGHERENLQLACNPCGQKKDLEIYQREQLKKGMIKNPETIKKILSTTPL